VALAAMVVDHALAADWAAFIATALLSSATAALLFAWVIPRLERRPGAAERAAVVGLVLALTAIVPGIALLWLGIPVVVAGAGLALGLRGREGARRRLATVAALLGALGLVGGFAVELGIELTDTETD
jgi:hypothetical protein